MKKDSKPPPPLAGLSKDALKNLRQQAEEILRKQHVDRVPVSPEDAQRLLHELEVHQIELEMQNEEMRRAQQELEASRMRYFELYDLAPVGYFTISDKGIILKANLLSAAALGIVKSELVSKPLTRFITPDDQDIYYLFLRELFEIREPHECELRLKKKDGTQFWVRLEATAAKGVDGAPVCRVVMFDITERRHIEDAQLFLLRCGYKDASEDFFESLACYLAESLNMAHVRIDRLQSNRLTAKTVAVYCDGKVEDNVEYTLQDTPAYDTVGKTVCSFPKDVCSLFPRDRGLQELRAESYVGTTLWNSAGRPIGLIAAIGRQQLTNPRPVEMMLKLMAVRAAGELERRDTQQLLKKAGEDLLAHSRELEATNELLNEEIKRRMLAEQVLTHYTESLMRSNDELDSFSSSVSHDLQEPIRSIAGMLNRLEKKYAGALDAEGTDYIARGLKNAQRLSAMINELLLYARLATRGGKFEEHDGAEILAEALENLHSTVEHSRAAITTDPLPRVYGDRNQLIRVFQNLIANSIRYCDKDAPVIHVSSQQKSDHYLFAVRDNGAGIDPDHHQSIFDLFKRGDNTNQQSGSGIGLAVCKKIIERHGGRLWVESKPGEGATFYFALQGIEMLKTPGGGMPENPQ